MSKIICKYCGYHNTGTDSRCHQCGAMLTFGFIPCTECGGTGRIFLHYTDEYDSEGDPKERYLPCAVCGGRGKRDPEVLRREATESRLKGLAYVALGLLAFFLDGDRPSHL